MSVNHLFDLLLVFVFNGSEHGLLVVLHFALVKRAPLLQLLERHLEFLLRLDQVPFVVALLSLEELNFAFP